MTMGLKLEALLLVLQTGALLLLGGRYVLLLRREAERVQRLEQDVAKKEQMRREERSGRVAAEKELRRVVDEKLDTRNGFYAQPIGHVQSCFKTCLGTPRQGSLAPSTRAKVVLQRSVSPEALIGLKHFSHVWIVFVFHLNTNGKNSRAHQGLRSDSHRFTFPAKIAPPMLKERVGVFSTRSPHRPNPVGITLATIASIDQGARTVFLTGVDLVDGTPVLDIKPYVPAYDSIPDARVASWLSTPQPRLHIEWQDRVASIAAVRVLAAKSTHFRDSPDAFVAAIEEVLRVDVRSRDQNRRMTSAERVNRLVLDNASVEYVFRKLDSDGDADGDLHLRIAGISAA